MMNRIGLALATAAATALLATATASLAQLYPPPPPAAATRADAKAPTPRTPDGKPDLTGFWGVPNRDAERAKEEDGVVTTILQTRNGAIDNFHEDPYIIGRQTNNLPVYKPEYWDKVQELDLDGIQKDPGFTCAPKGVPRMGAPHKIVQTADELLFFQNSTFVHNEFRIIPIDGRGHDEIRVLDGTFLGDSVGHWEGDTMVIETIGFGEESWFGEEGYFHSTEMKVTERLRREGDVLYYDMTLEDPEVLMQPYVEETRVIRRNPSKNLIIMEAPPCVEKDRENMVLKIR